MAETESTAGAQGRQHQLPLEIRLRDDATLENFLALGRLQPLLDSLQSQLSPDGEPLVFLHGPAGVGKSHLLQASCHVDSSETLYLPLAELSQFPAEEVLQGVETLGRICLDDIQAVLGDMHWERGLFNLINAARQSGARLVVAGNAAPRVLSVDLPDLRSRLSGGIVYQLEEVDDEGKAAILEFRARLRGLNLLDGVATYIVNRAPRATQQLLDVLDRLDEASLVEKRALSIPFVKEAMGW